MEIILPENISDIKLKQFLDYMELQSRKMDALNHDKRKVSIFTGIPYKHVKHIKRADFDRILNQIDIGLSTEVPFTQRFTLHDIEFGFIPNLDDITIGEYADISAYGVKDETLHKLMAVLFRPIIKKEGDSYTIMPYEGTEEFAELMKDMPMNCVNGALVFFWNLASELQTATQRYLTEELLKEMRPPNTSRLSAGTQRLINWLKETFYGIKR